MVVATKVRLLAARVCCPLCRGSLETPDDPAARCFACGTAYHAACVAELGVACTTIGCARGPAYPAPRLVPLAAPPPRVELLARPPGLAWPLVVTWLLVAFWPLALVGWGWALRRAWRRPRRARAVAAALVLSPFVALPALSAGRAVVAYASGSAVLVTSRLEPYVGLDPEVRCPQQEGGHVGRASTFDVHDLVVRGLARLLGPMPGGYDGPLPPASEAAALLAGPAARLGSTLDSPEWGSERLVVVAGGRPIALELPWTLTAYAFGTDARTSRPVRVVPLDGRSFLVAALGDPASALVCDAEAGRAVALVPFRSSPRPFGR